MVEKCTLECDGCGDEIVKGSYVHREFYLVLSYEIRPDVNYTTGQPPINGMKHFCDMDCLRDWLEGGEL